MNRRKVGTQFEQLAAQYLEKQGYRILETNFRCRQGEIDLIAQEGEYLVFCEVKYRSDGMSGDPLEAVDRRKQGKILRTAKYYLFENGLSEDTPCRFDVIGMADGHIRLLRNAFEV